MKKLVIPIVTALALLLCLGAALKVSELTVVTTPGDTNLVLLTATNGSGGTHWTVTLGDLATNVFNRPALNAATNSLHTRAGNAEAATNALHTRAGNAEAATNSLHTRAGNAEAATNSLHTRAGNAEAATNSLHTGRQPASATLTNLAGTGAVTNTGSATALSIGRAFTPTNYVGFLTVTGAVNTSAGTALNAGSASAGRVRLASGYGSFIITNSLVTANSIVLVTQNTTDPSGQGLIAVPSSGLITINCVLGAGNDNDVDISWIVIQP